MDDKSGSLGSPGLPDQGLPVAFLMDWGQNLGWNISLKFENASTALQVRYFWSCYAQKLVLFGKKCKFWPKKSEIVQTLTSPDFQTEKVFHPNFAPNPFKM